MYEGGFVSIASRPKEMPVGEWSPAALRLLHERYLVKNRQGDAVEVPEDMLWRVASAVAQVEHVHGAGREEIESIAREFYLMMVRCLFLPNSPTLLNAGRNPGMPLAACFVLPIEDSVESIVGAMATAALIQKAGGGTGFAFSRLRPSGSYIRSSSGASSGPVSFIRNFDHLTGVIKAGSTRRGANMAVMRVDHPDIVEFVDAKRGGGLTNFNVSVAITREFMEALKASSQYAIRARAGWPRPDGGTYAEGEEYVDPVTRAPATLDAGMMWTRIIQAGWQTGDPGLFFVDRANESSASPIRGEYVIESTNPCGEVPLYPNDQCILGSINVGAFVDEASRDFRWGELGEVAKLATRFLDNVVEISHSPTPEIAAMVRSIRRIGLGVMGWADALARLRLPYDSEEAVSLASLLMRFITETAEQSSIALAAVRGPFPLQGESIYCGGPGRRNATVTTIAPTGTISLIAGCSSGIEPYYAVAFTHTVKRDDGERRLHLFNKVFRELAMTRGIWSEALEAAVARSGSVRGQLLVPEDLQRIFPTAHEVGGRWHVRHQAAFQAHTHNGVSKTVNLPRWATVGDVEDAYRAAWDLGCLGITVFRDGCKAEQVMTVGSAGEPALASASASNGLRLEAEVSDAGVEDRPDSLGSRTFGVDTSLGKAYVTVTLLNDEPFEVFVNMGKGGTDTASMAEAIGRLSTVILGLRRSASRTDRARRVASELRHIAGSRDVGLGEKRIRSVPDALAWALEEVLNDEGKSSLREREAMSGDLCPECGAGAVVREEGCRHCLACGYAEC